jgi:hypothetical protein
VCGKPAPSTLPADIASGALAIRLIITCRALRVPWIAGSESAFRSPAAPILSQRIVLQRNFLDHQRHDIQ